MHDDDLSHSFETRISPFGRNDKTGWVITANLSIEPGDSKPHQNWISPFSRNDSSFVEQLNETLAA